MPLYLPGAAAGSLTGTTLASNVVGSSLTSVGALASGSWAATAIPAAKGGLTLTAWADYTPVLTCTVGTFTSYTVNRGAFIQTGKAVFVNIDISVTAIGTAAGSPIISLPASPNASGYQCLVGWEVGLTGVMIYMRVINGILQTYLATAPSIANTARYALSGVYEAA